MERQHHVCSGDNENIMIQIGPDDEEYIVPFERRKSSRQSPAHKFCLLVWLESLQIQMIGLVETRCHVIFNLF